MVSSRGVTIAQGPVYWPQKNTAETLTYALDMTAWLAAVPDDELASVSATIPWAVSGDAQVIQVAVSYGGLISIQVAAGRPGVTYAVLVTGTTALGSTFEETALLPIEAPFVEAGEPVPTPATTVAATITWAYGPAYDFGDPANSMYL